MSMIDTVRDLQNNTAAAQRENAARARKESTEEGSRNVGDVMGKHDFLMLLTAQLRYQDPLNPQSDSEFASQLAQFSSLEQMMNMSESLNVLTDYQSLSYIGKYVLAEVYMEDRADGEMKLMEVAGIVDSIFTEKGVKMAQVGIYQVPLTSIVEVFDSSALITSESLLQASNSLLGREVSAQIGDGENAKIYSGIVISVNAESGVIFATIDDGSGELKRIPTGSIYDIRQPGYTTPPVQNTDIPALDRPNIVADGNGYIEYDGEERNNQYGRWDWDAELEKWIPTGAYIYDGEQRVGQFDWNADLEEWIANLNLAAPPVEPGSGTPEGGGVPPESGDLPPEGENIPPESGDLPPEGETGQEGNDPGNTGGSGEGSGDGDDGGLDGGMAA